MKKLLFLVVFSVFVGGWCCDDNTPAPEPVTVPAPATAPVPTNDDSGLSIGTNGVPVVGEGLGIGFDGKLYIAPGGGIAFPLP